MRKEKFGKENSKVREIKKLRNWMMIQKQGQGV